MPEKALVYDPAADGRRPGIIRGETWWPWEDVLSFAAALRLGKKRVLGPGRFYAGFIEARDVEEEAAHHEPQVVNEALRTAVQAPVVRLRKGAKKTTPFPDRTRINPPSPARK